MTWGYDNVKWSSQDNYYSTSAPATVTVDNVESGDSILVGLNSDYVHASQVSPFTALLDGHNGPGYGSSWIYERTADGTETSYDFGAPGNDPLWVSVALLVLDTAGSASYATVDYTASGGSYPGQTLSSVQNTELVFLYEQANNPVTSAPAGFEKVADCGGLSTGRLGVEIWARRALAGSTTASGSFSIASGSIEYLAWTAVNLFYPGEWHVGSSHFGEW